MIDFDEVTAAPLFEALAKAQAEFPEVEKNRIAEVRMKTGGTFKFKYADLSDVTKAVRPTLNKHGLAVMQFVRGEEIITRITHASGAALQDAYPIHTKSEGRMHPGQEFAISVMYARRYGLTAALGIATEETVDDAKNKMVSRDFQDPERDGIIGVRGVKVDHKSTPEERAKAYADGIIKLFEDAKTPAGLNGAWERNEKVIDRLQDSYPSDYANVLDAYEARQAALSNGGDE